MGEVYLENRVHEKGKTIDHSFVEVLVAELNKISRCRLDKAKCSP